MASTHLAQIGKAFVGELVLENGRTAPFGVFTRDNYGFRHNDGQLLRLIENEEVRGVKGINWHSNISSTYAGGERPVNASDEADLPLIKLVNDLF